MDSGIRKSDINIPKNWENPVNIRINLISPETILSLSGPHKCNTATIQQQYKNFFL